MNSVQPNHPLPVFVYIRANIPNLCLKNKAKCSPLILLYVSVLNIVSALNLKDIESFK